MDWKRKVIKSVTRTRSLTEEHRLLVFMLTITLSVYVVFSLMNYHLIVGHQLTQLQFHSKTSATFMASFMETDVLERMYDLSGLESPQYLKVRDLLDRTATFDKSIRSAYILGIDEELTTNGKTFFLAVPSSDLREIDLRKPYIQPQTLISSLKQVVLTRSAVTTSAYVRDNETVITTLIPVIGTSGQIHMVIGVDHFAKALDEAFDAFLINLLTATFILILFMGQLMIGLRLLRERGQLRQQIEVSEEALKKHVAAAMESERLAALGSLAANMTHEITIPLDRTTKRLVNLADTTRELCSKLELGQMTDVDMGKYLNRISDGIPSVTKNLTDMKDLLSTFEILSDTRHDDRRTWFNINETLEAIHSTHKFDMGQKIVAFHVTCPPDLMIHSDVSAFMQVFDNLLTNSLNHGWVDKRQLHIRIYAHQTDENELTLTYTDDGRGIPAEHLPHIFEPFFTADVPTAGTGLGLHVVNHLVRHNLSGTIEVNSVPDVDTCFTLILPQRV